MLIRNVRGKRRRLPLPFGLDGIGRRFRMVRLGQPCVVLVNILQVGTLCKFRRDHCPLR